MPCNSGFMLFLSVDSGLASAYDGAGPVSLHRSFLVCSFARLNSFGFWISGWSGHSMTSGAARHCRLQRAFFPDHFSPPITIKQFL